jgi:hypothetical protein
MRLLVIDERSIPSVRFVAARSVVPVFAIASMDSHVSIKIIEADEGWTATRLGAHQFVLPVFSDYGVLLSTGWCVLRRSAILLDELVVLPC